MRFKPDIDRVRERLDAFWAMEMADRALISVVAPKERGAHISQFHNPEDLTGDKEALRRYWEDPETIRINNIERLERTFLGGESLPSIFQNYGTSGHCNYFGAKPKYGNDTIWFDHTLESLEDIDGAYTEELLDKHLHIARYLTERAGDEYFVAMPDSTGTIDALGHLYGTENVLMDMISDPEAVLHAIEVVNDGWIKTNEMFHQISSGVNRGGCHAWMHLLAPGRIQHLQCDMSVMFSKEMYERFAMPELIRQMEWCEYPIYHFDGVEQVRHLDLLLSLDRLKGIQWTAVAGQPSAAHHIDILRRMQSAGKRLIVMAPPTDVKPLLEGLSAKGLYIHTQTDSMEEAQDLIRLTEELSKE